VRRTSSMTMTWPDGRLGALALEGSARDLLTIQLEQPPRVLTEVRLKVRIAPDRHIIDLSADPPCPAQAGLVGLPSISGFRAQLATMLKAEADSGSPLYLLLDDIAGSSLISTWAWTRWPETQLIQDRAHADKRLSMEGICSGFAPGSSALIPDGHRQSAADVHSLVHPDDPQGWHTLPPDEGVSMRRARRMDVWQNEGSIRVDAMFQDSATAPGDRREAVHEYHLAGVAEARGGRLVEIVADPRVLPYPECPAAAGNVGLLLGTSLRNLRARVMERLCRTSGCTHLNDALRALAEVPQLAARLRQEPKANGN
jgi:hypothetical protein